MSVGIEIQSSTQTMLISWAIASQNVFVFYQLGEIVKYILLFRVTWFGMVLLFMANGPFVFILRTRAELWV
jgi:hypothetical protein